MLSKCQKERSRIINANTERFPRHIKFFKKASHRKINPDVFTYVRFRNMQNWTMYYNVVFYVCMVNYKERKKRKL